MVAQQLHGGFAAYLASRQADQPIRNADGSVSLVFDGQYRITCLGNASGGLLVEARVTELPLDANARRSLLEDLLERAGRRFERHTEWMTMTRDRQILLLQQTVPAQADKTDFESALERFINALAGWRTLAGVL